MSLFGTLPTETYVEPGVKRLSEVWIKMIRLIDDEAI